VATTANQITLYFVLEKRRRGKSQMAQSVGTIGRITITATINKFNALKVIYKLPDISLNAAMSRSAAGQNFLLNRDV